MIEPIRQTFPSNAYLDLPGLCEKRGDHGLKLSNINFTDADRNLSVFFPDNRTGQNNQFNQAPYCLAFITVSIEGPTVLMWSDDGEPLLSVGAVIKLAISGTSVSFNSTSTNFTKAQRLQICTNGTHAIYYIDCKEMETKPFVMTSSSGINTLSIIGKRNQTTFLFDEVFNVSMWHTKGVNFIGLFTL